MKKVALPLLMLITILLTGCSFSEDLYINEDGSGRISINFDASELMKMGGRELNTNEEVIDSVISFKQLLEDKKDSIATLAPAEQARLKKLENFNMHMVVNGDDMDIDLYTDFKEVSELSDVFSAFQNAATFNTKGENTPESPISVGTDATEVSYSLEKNVFKRIGIVKDYELLQKNVDSLGAVEMLLSSSTYTINYHFPKKIKSVSTKGAIISEDKKSVTYKVAFMDYMEDPGSLDIEVIFEN